MQKTLTRITKALLSRGFYNHTLHVFDLDDTLLLTKPLVKAAFLQVGVTEDRFNQNWGNAASMWLTPEIIAQKKVAYESILKSRSNTPIHTALNLLANDPNLRGKVYTLTSASRYSYELLQRYVGHLPPLLASDCQLHAKISELRKLQMYFQGNVIYYDDDKQNIETIRQSFHNNPGFKGILCHFGETVSFTNLSGEGEAAWTV